MTVRLVLKNVELRPHPAGDGLLLRLGDDAGRVGLGEAVARPGFSAPIATLRAAGARLSTDLRERTISTVDAAQTLSADLRSADATPLPSPLRFAVDTALLDLLGQARGQTIAQLLAPHLGSATLARSEAAEATPKKNSCVAIERNALVHSNADAQVLAALRHRGFKTIKVKARGPWPQSLRELRALATILRETGPGKLRIDCNGTIAKADAPAILRALAELSPEYVEEPVSGLAAGEWADLANYGVPLAIDESAIDDAAWREHVERGSACVAVIKPAFVGGLFSALRRVREARARGLEVVITSALEGAIGTAAAAHLAFAIGATTAFGITARPGGPAPAWLASDRPLIDVPSAPGLGVSDPSTGAL